MSLSISLAPRQSQSLVLTPQLLQSIRLLQFGNQELQAFLEREAERNPLLRVEGRGPGERATRTERAAPREASAPARSSGTDPHILEATIADRPSLHAHARDEAAAILRTATDLRIAEALLADLDESGYLRVNAAAAAAQLGVLQETVERIVEALRTAAEPAGLFAADLADCLARQLARLNRLDPVIAIVLSRLDLLARRDFATLRRLTGEDDAGLLEILAEIRHLDPRPGAGFSPPERDAVTPEILVAAAPDGGWRVELNGTALPRVLVDNAYAVNAGKLCRTDDDRVFVGECQASASWLVRALDQRAKTILKVACEIVRRQEAFLDEGIGGLRPMTLAQVASAVGLHESTVSRVTANKFVATPRGMFEMKYFFTVAIASSTGGDAHSAEDVKGRIRRLVATETAAGVLSDEDIVARLKAEGVDLARRTVAKYREGMGIASSVQRRRELKARRLAS